MNISLSLPISLHSSSSSFSPGGLLGALPREQAADVIHAHARPLPASSGNRELRRPPELVHVLRQDRLQAARAVVENAAKLKKKILETNGGSGGGAGDLGRSCVDRGGGGSWLW